MTQLRKKVANGLDAFFAWGEALALFAAIVFFVILLGKAMQPLSPIITILVIIGFTAHAFASDKLNAVGVLTGLAIYGLAWPVTQHYGVAFGMTVWTIGVVLWFAAVTRSFPRAWAVIAA